MGTCNAGISENVFNPYRTTSALQRSFLQCPPLSFPNLSQLLVSQAPARNSSSYLGFNSVKALGEKNRIQNTTFGLLTSFVLYIDGADCCGETSKNDMSHDGPIAMAGGWQRCFFRVKHFLVDHGACFPVFNIVTFNISGSLERSLFLYSTYLVGKRVKNKVPWVSYRDDLRQSMRICRYLSILTPKKKHHHLIFVGHLNETHSNRGWLTRNS